MKSRLYVGDRLFSYGFEDHPLSRDRYKFFLDLFRRDSGLARGLEVIGVDGLCSDDEILYLFHTRDYVEKVKRLSERGYGYIDYGDTPVFKGIYEVSLESVCVSCHGADYAFKFSGIAFNLAGGWHHAYRDRGGGFCVFNDIGVSIEYIRSRYGHDITFFYVDIDAHHGDGVYYSYEYDPKVYIFDIHEDGRFLYPGTGFSSERGRGEAFGTKFNVPLPPWSSDSELHRYIDECLEHLYRVGPDIILFQAGQDGLAGDPITHLSYTDEGYLDAVAKVFRAGKELGVGILFLGGGGYQPERVARNWVKVLRVAVNL